LHTGGERGKGDEAEFHRKFFEKLVNKNAIKPKIGDPLANLSKMPGPPEILVLICASPSPLNFQLCASMSKIWAGTTDMFQEEQINLRLTCKQKQPICFKKNK